MNTLKAYVFLLILTVFLILLGDIIAGHDGIYVAVLIAFITDATAFFSSDKAMLNLYHAKAIPNDNHPHLHALTKSLATKAGIPTPKLYLIDSNAANLFAIGRHPSDAGIAVTKGLMQLLTEEEQESVLAQMIAQIINRSAFLNAISATVARGFSGLASLHTSEILFDEKDPTEKPGFNEKIMAVVGPIAALIIKSVSTPKMTLDADKAAMQYCQHSEWLISALQKLEANKKEVSFKRADYLPATAHLFLINPLNNPKWAARFQTQPTTAVRIDHLKSPA